MKKALKLFIALILVGISSYATEKFNSTTRVNVVGEREFAVELLDVKGFSKVSLYNDKGENVASQRVTDRQQIRYLFDLSYLQSGEYELIVADRRSKQYIPVSVFKNKIEVKMEEARKVFFPRIEQSDDVLLVKFLSDEENEFRVSIYSEYGDLLFEEEMRGKRGLLARKFKFESGNYSVVLSSDGYSEAKNYTFK